MDRKYTDGWRVNLKPKSSTWHIDETFDVSSMSEIPVRSRPRRLVDWINPTGPRRSIRYGHSACSGTTLHTGGSCGRAAGGIVKRKLATHYWPHQDPIGKRLRIGTPEMRTPWLTVVGEVADVQLGSPDTKMAEQFYQPVEQAEASLGSLASPGDLNGNSGSIALHSALPPEQVENALRAAMHSLDPLLPLTRVLTHELGGFGAEEPQILIAVWVAGDMPACG